LQPTSQKQVTKLHSYELVKKHLPILRELELATDRSNYIAKSSDGTIIEVFEWTSQNATKAAHQHPAITDIWEKNDIDCRFYSNDFIARRAASISRI
jgi:hypothetical protein